MEQRRHSLNVPNASSDGTHEIVFYDWGDINAMTTTICVHGLTRNAHDFDILAETLAKTGRRVLSISMAGRGESAWLADPMGYNYGTYVNDCIAVMDNFHIREVEWIGTSMGGIIGMTIAAHHYDRIGKLVMNDVGSFLSKEALTRIYDYIQKMPTHFADRAAADAYLRGAFSSFGITDPQLWERFIDQSLITDAAGKLRYACDPAIIEPIRANTADFAEIADINLIDTWDKLRLSTLILHGADSDVLLPATIRTMRGSNINAESITFPNVGHAPALMTPAQINPVINWLNDTTSGLLSKSF